PAAPRRRRISRGRSRLGIRQRRLLLVQQKTAQKREAAGPMQKRTWQENGPRESSKPRRRSPAHSERGVNARPPRPRSVGSAATRLLCFWGSMKKDAEHGHRIVSLAPSATAILCAIGANKTLVGGTKWCADVATVGVLPKLGDRWHMGPLDEILRLKPLLVIGSVDYTQETVVKLLEQPPHSLAVTPH